MMIFLPLWVGFGRAFFGAMGWYVIVLTVPILMPALLISLMDLRKRIDANGAKETKSVSQPQALLFLLLYLASFLFGLTLVDGGDTPESGGSALTKLFGASEFVPSGNDIFHGALTVENPIFTVSSYLSVLGFVVTVMFIVVLFVNTRKNPSVAAGTSVKS
jgi:hypothetical protein